MHTSSVFIGWNVTHQNPEQRSTGTMTKFMKCFKEIWQEESKQWLSHDED